VEPEKPCFIVGARIPHGQRHFGSYLGKLGGKCFNRFFTEIILITTVKSAQNNVIIDIVIANNIISKLLKMAFWGIIIVR